VVDVSAASSQGWYGRLLLPDRVAVGRLTVEGDRIAAVLPDRDAAGDAAGAAAGAAVAGDAATRAALAGDLPWIVPGYIDVHLHGGGGGDTMDGPDGVRRLAATHLRHGTTSLLASTLTAPWAEVLAALRGVAEVAAEPVNPHEPRAQVLGAHLEGPFINPRRLGAQPPHAIVPTTARIAEVLALDVVRTVTLAPEIDGVPAAATAFARAGVVVAVGHTLADADTVARTFAAARAAAADAGEPAPVSATHLFNAMGGMSGREPGVVGAVLGDPDAFAELIVDGFHVAPAAVRATFAAKPARTLLITDAMRATGLGDGPSVLGGAPVTVSGGAARLADGTLAGSVLTLDVAVRRAVAMGVPAEAALRAATATPAALLRLRDRGRLNVGARADLLVLAPDLTLTEVWQGGVRVA